jgi:heme A synthase|tara:strand:- start:164 stop:349 length:186 start_codon:yes stop_codon:yes gene_type:complete
MKRKERFETLIALAMLILSAFIAMLAVSLDLPIVTYFFIGMVLLFAAIVIAYLSDESEKRK